MGAPATSAPKRTSGELICFLTQDATPVPGWAVAYREAFALDAHVGAAYGPHLPRADTSPMIARELTEFFGSFALDGADPGPTVQRREIRRFLSNVNACYARACWEEIRFREIAYSEDQAFGADLLAAGWVKVYQPAAAVLHAHDYGALEFMRRYFDEYRGLHESTGHVEPFGVLATARQVRARGGRRPSLDGRARPRRRRAGALDRALRRAPRRTARVLGARLPRRPSASARPRAAVAGGPRRSCRDRRRRRVRLGAGQLNGRDANLAPDAARPSPRSHRARTCRPSATTTTTRTSPASGARARRRCSTPCPGWPSASACAWRW